MPKLVEVASQLTCSLHLDYQTRNLTVLNQLRYPLPPCIERAYLTNTTPPTAYEQYGAVLLAFTIRPGHRWVLCEVASDHEKGYVVVDEYRHDDQIQIPRHLICGPGIAKGIPLAGIVFAHNADAEYRISLGIRGYHPGCDENHFTLNGTSYQTVKLQQ